MTRAVTVAYAVLSAAIVLWDVFLAGQIARLRSAPRLFAAVTALVGLLVVPALLVAAASGSILNGRAIHDAAWVWPLATALFAVQALYATGRGSSGSPSPRMTFSSPWPPWPAS
jgi:hypothetical protein